MKEVWVMRHGAQEKIEEPGIWKPSAPLSEEGRKDIERVREAYLSGVDFIYAGCSPFVRARETLDVALPDYPVGREYLHGLAPVSVRVWDWVVETHPEYLNRNLQEIYAKEPALMRLEGERTLQCIQEVARRLSDGQRALLVSHQPLIECAVAEATNTWPPELSLQRAEIVKFLFSGDLFTGYEHLPLP